MHNVKNLGSTETLINLVNYKHLPDFISLFFTISIVLPMVLQMPIAHQVNIVRLLGLPLLRTQLMHTSMMPYGLLFMTIISTSSYCIAIHHLQYCH